MEATRRPWDAASPITDNPRARSAARASPPSMFIAAKLLAFVTQPLAWAALLWLAALLGMSWRRRWALMLGWAGLLIVLLQGWEPLPDALLRKLESRYPRLSMSASSLRQYQGVVVLGGALEPAYVWAGHDQAALNDAAERMTVPLILMRQHPELRLIFTGGEGELFASGPSEAARARLFYDSMGIAPGQVRYESASRTTYENAVLSSHLDGVNPARPWLLLTSAFHMPRAMAAFRRAGWNVTAYPVDFRTGLGTPWSQYSMAAGARKWKIALHELLGLLTYQLTGRA